MPIKNIVHGIAKNVAERTAPGYVPPPPPPLNAADKHRLIKAKARIETIAQKLEMLAAALTATHKELAPYKFQEFDLARVSQSLADDRRDLLQHIARLEQAIK